MNGHQVFLSQSKELLETFSKLAVTQCDPFKGVVIAGEIDVIDPSGKLWDTYLIEIHSTEPFPRRFPLVFEVGGKIPQIGDWHINEDSKSCCIKVLPEELIRCAQGITLTEFVKSEVAPYFFNQSHRQHEGYYVNGEYSHGLLGIIEGYGKILRTEKTPLTTLKFMQAIGSMRKPTRNDKCFCGSGILFRKCHRNSYQSLMLIETEMKVHLAKILEVINLAAK